MDAEDRCFCDLVPLYVLGLLDEEERRWVEAQVAQTPELATELQELQAAATTLSYAAPIAPLASDLKNRLFQRLDLSSQNADRSALPSSPSGTVLPFRQHSSESARPSRPDASPVTSPVVWRRVGSAIAAMLVAALLIDNLRLRQDMQSTNQAIATLQQPDTVIYTLKGTEKAAQASGRLVINPRQHEVIMVAQQLPALPAGQTYRLWAMPAKATQPIFCGQFNSLQPGTAAHWSLPVAACSGTGAQMLITAESTASPLQPKGALVMKSLL